MLTEWVVSAYRTLVEIALWVFLIAGGIVGAGIGGIGGHGFIGFVVGGAAGFFGMAVFLGAALVLGEIHKSVCQIEKKLKESAGNSHEAYARQGQQSKPEQPSKPISAE